MRISKKITALFIAVMMVVSAIPFTASAASDPYLTFTGTDSFSLKTNNSTKNWDGTLQYSTNASTWTTWDGTSPISSVNNVLYLRGTGNTQITGSNYSNRWVITTQGTVACSGDIRTLLDYTDPESSSMGIYCFAYLFRNCTSLTAAPELPATNLKTNCYYYMFRGCTSLTTAPELPATMLAEGCYAGMFYGCESLTTAPDLPATTLTDACYFSMFNGCTSLTTAPALPSTMLTRDCYSGMFADCESLTTAPELPATTLANYCYYNMFNGCRSLTTAPELWATTLTNYCYTGMFQDCTSLTTPPALWATDLTSSCYKEMFKGCTGIKLSTEQTPEYSVPYSIPEEGTGSMGTDSLTDMFTNTGGTFTGTPTINTTYYIPAPISSVAKVNGVGYETLEEAIEAAQSGDTITLLDDVTVTSTVVFPAGKSLSLDLNDHTISGSVAGKLIRNEGTLTITGSNGGHIYNTNVAGQSRDAIYNTGTLTVNAPVYIGDADEDLTNSCAVNRGAAVRNYGGTVTINNGYYTNIDNANGVYAYALINDNNGTMTVNDATVYGHNHGNIANNSGTVNVNGGTFSVDKTYSNSDYNLYVCETSVTNVTGGTFTSTGNTAAICVDTDDYVSAAINISGGTFNYNTKFKATSATDDKVNVSGGSFSSVVPAACCAEGFIPVTTPDPVTGKYTVEEPEGGYLVGTTLYNDFEEAVAAARTGSIKKVICCSDVDLTQYPAFNAAGSMHYIDISGVTVDLNDNEMTIGSRFSVLFTGENGKIMNGTCTGTDCAKWPEYRYGLYLWGSGSGDIRDSDGSSTSIALEDLTVNGGIHVWNADVTITDCDSTGSNSYYGVWADELSNVTIKSGNFTTGGAAVLGAAQSSDGEGHINIEDGNFTVPSGKLLVLGASSSSKPQNVKFSGGTANVPINPINCADGFIPAEGSTPGTYTVTQPHNGANITVADTISENFYLDEETYGDSTYVAINYNHNSNASQTASFSTDVVAMSSLPEQSSGDYAGNRIVSVTQAPAQATEDITITVYASQADAQAGTNPVDVITYNVYDYCRAIITGDYAENFKELAETTLDYAASAQLLFNYNTDNMATKDNDSNAFYNDVAGADLSGVEGITTKPACITSATMVVKSDLEINLLSETPISVTGYNLETTTGGTRFAVTSYQNGNYYVVHIAGIEPANMDNTITVYTDQGDIVLTANAIMKIMANAGSENLATLAKAMYLYGAAANNYFGA